ncbi:hypothetical protein A0256_13675 [Mucilaginibacter sp. PAMC 26640]|nr:hypothetical protein A0256_13675 [Mucilaginibacter sp. PAMC 26640]
MTKLKQNPDLTNNQDYKNQNLGIVSAISVFFESHQLHEAKEALFELQHAWGSRHRLFRNHHDIGSMVFFVTNLNSLVRKIGQFDCITHPVDNRTDTRTAVIEFLNESGSISEDILNEALQFWIEATASADRSNVELTRGEYVFATIPDFFDVCSEILEGGVLCA